MVAGPGVVIVAGDPVRLGNGPARSIRRPGELHRQRCYRGAAKVVSSNNPQGKMPSNPKNFF